MSLRDIVVVPVEGTAGSECSNDSGCTG
ncbi:hypothetical protein GBAR_LOCUS3905 [Geodia barretti]|uniref:Uncharacterized protein n=1 Tax=Geodia barretti TaxID=519541 RepID=A0AA35R4U8_GEOBA|nr:hypothetical protein GBAR_LOCUS3905 [Geodia barretti]